MGSLLILYSIISGGFYVFFRISKIKDLKAPKILAIIIFTGLLAYVTYTLRLILPYLRFAAMVSMSAFFIRLLTGINAKTVLIAMAMSLGISYSFYGLGTPIAFLLLWIASSDKSYLSDILNIAFLIILIGLPFRISKCKKWLLNYHEEAWVEGPGLLFSVLIVIAGTIIGNGRSTETIWLFIAIPVLAGGFVYSGISGTKRYLEKRRLEAAQEAENKKRRVLIHDYNLSVTTAYRTIKAFSMEMGAEISGDFLERLAVAEKSLGALSEEISEESLENRIEYKDIPKTGVSIVDESLQCMAARMERDNVRFEVDISAGMECLISDVLLEATLSRLINNLINNAKYAAGKGDIRLVRFNAGFSNEGHYVIAVYDSGIPFEPHTLVKLGTENATTHESDGGRGDGYISIFRTLKMVNASIVIIEGDLPDTRFSKCVKIQFDNKGEYIIETNREDKFRDFESRRELRIHKPTQARTVPDKKAKK